MAKMCHCGRGFVYHRDKCCCVYCERERQYDHYYNNTDAPRQAFGTNVEPIRPPKQVWRGKRNPEDGAA